jgi:hypothetical protein
MSSYRILATLLVISTAALGVHAQEQKPIAGGQAASGRKSGAQAQQGEEKKKPRRTFEEFVADWMTPKPFPKNQVVKIDDRYAYPHVVAGIKMEIVREDDEYVWLRGISPEDPNSPLYKVWAQREAEEARAADWAEFSNQPGAVNFMDFGAVMVPPPDMESLTFVSGSGTLPNKGRWQMGFAVADMNEDGHQDLVFPPQRKQLPPAPSILLGDGTGNFSYWNESKWPEAMPWDYGDVVAGDFNNDGHQDVVFAVHFKSQFALFGNGDGRFPSGGILPSPDPRVTSRAVTAADFDGDGRTDLAFVAEIDYDVTSNARFEGSPSAWVLFNRGDDWEISSEGLPQNLIADVIRSADLDGDGRPELIISSNTLGPRMLVYSWRDAEGWVAAEHRGLLSASYHYDVEPTVGGVFSTFVQFGRFQSATQARNGLIHYPTSFDGEFETPVPLVWDKERGNVFFRLAVGDLDGDGHPDLVAGRKNGGLEVYLQSEDGSFYRERGTELDSVGRAFDIRLVDLDGDGRDDIIAGCVEQDERPGGIYVWLSRPSV